MSIQIHEMKMNDPEAIQRRDAGLKNFMASPQLKLLCSLVPATNPPEVLQTLLTAAYYEGFESGVDAGVIMSARGIMEALNKAEPK